MEVVYDGYEPVSAELKARFTNESAVPKLHRWAIACPRCSRKVCCVGARALELQLSKMSAGDPCSAPCDAAMMAVAREGAAQ